MKDIGEPQSLKDIERFLGKGKYLVNHVRDFLQMASPLHKIKWELKRGKGMLTQTYIPWKVLKDVILNAVELEKRDEKVPMEIHTTLTKGGISLECCNCLKHLSYTFTRPKQKFSQDD